MTVLTGLKVARGSSTKMVSHGTVPKAGEFLRFECGGSFGLLADESGGGVDILPKVEIAAVVVLGSAY